MKKKRIKLNLSLIFIFLFLIYILLNSSLFSLRNIEIVGNDNISDEKIIKALGLKKGVEIWNINLEKLANPVPDLLIESVKIRRVLPDKIIVEVRERKGLGWIIYEGLAYLVDKEGFIIKKSEIGNELGLDCPLILGINYLKQTERKIDSGPQGKIILAYLKQLGPEISNLISQVVLEEENIYFHLTNKTEIRTSLERDVDEMSRLILSLRSLLASGKVEYLDLRFKGAPVFKYK